MLADILQGGERTCGAGGSAALLFVVFLNQRVVLLHPLRKGDDQLLALFAEALPLLGCRCMGGKMWVAQSKQR